MTSSDNLFRKEEAFAAALKVLFEEFPLGDPPAQPPHDRVWCQTNRALATQPRLGLRIMGSAAIGSGVPRDRVEALLTLLK